MNDRAPSLQTGTMVMLCVLAVLEISLFFFLDPFSCRGLLSNFAASDTGSWEKVCVQHTGNLWFTCVVYLLNADWVVGLLVRDPATREAQFTLGKHNFFNLLVKGLVRESQGDRHKVIDGHDGRRVCGENLRVAISSKSYAILP